MDRGRARTQFACGAAVFVVTLAASRLPLAAWNVPFWVAAPVLLGGLDAAAWLTAGLRALECAVLSFVAAAVLGGVIVAFGQFADASPLQVTQEFVFWAGVLLALSWVVCLAVMFGRDALDDLRRRRSPPDAG